MLFRAKYVMSLVVITIFLILCVIILICRIDPKPTNWNVFSDDTWCVVAEGKLLGIEVVDNGFNYSLAFRDIDVATGRVRMLETINVGEVGILYKRDLGNVNKKSWFQWVTKEDIAAMKFEQLKNR